MRTERRHHLNQGRPRIAFRQNSCSSLIPSRVRRPRSKRARPLQKYEKQSVQQADGDDCHEHAAKQNHHATDTNTAIHNRAERFPSLAQNHSTARNFTHTGAGMLIGSPTAVS